MIDCTFIPSNANRLLQQHRPKSLVCSDPADRKKRYKTATARIKSRPNALAEHRNSQLQSAQQHINSSHKHSPQRSFPIDTAQPPRLPP